MLVSASATAEHEVLGSIPRLGEVSQSYSVRKFSVARAVGMEKHREEEPRYLKQRQ